MTSKRLLDVIIFGATGFTGKYTVFEACTVLKDFKWGVAGRDQQKLQNVLTTMSTKAGKSLDHIPIITADVNNYKSLVDMANRCRIVVNCCGPYRFFGEPVVRACIEAGTHHVDVSGESQYMESMQLKYDEEAKKKNVYIISACGFDSVPVDMGICYVEKNFDGVVNSVETYLKRSLSKGRKGGTSIHYGTWASAIHSLSTLGELREIRAKLFKEKLPQFLPKMQSKPLMHRSEIAGGICLPFPGPDVGVVQRSQRLLFEIDNKRPVQLKQYVTFGSRFAASMVLVFTSLFSIMIQFRLGRYLLLKYPKFFSGGFASHEGPTEETMEKMKFCFVIKALGWPKSNNLSEPTDQYTAEPTKSLIAEVSGTNPGYGATCVSLLCCATTILNEHDKMPGNGGCLPPAAAFSKTNLINELQRYEHGIKFNIVGKTKL